MSQLNNSNSGKLSLLKRCLPDVAAVLFFVLVAFAYFYPADTENRILYQHDSVAGAGAGQEAKEYLERTGERTRWTNSLFSGMPTYQIAPSYDSAKPLSFIEKAYHLWLPDNVWFLFASLLGFYILLRAFNFRQYLAVLGAVIWAFSTYFLIIIAAGHLWKVIALAYLPPLIAGVVLAFRGKYVWGLVVTALFAALQVHANHFQMTYYYLFVILFMVLAFIAEAVRKKEWLHIVKALGVCVVGALIGVAINISSLYQTKQYEKETMRGGSELSKPEGEKGADEGLDRSYITSYSYGIGETWSLLVPNVQGGASMRASSETTSGTDIFPLGESSAAKNVEEQEIKYVAKRTEDGQEVMGSASSTDMMSAMPQYWGDGITMGPVYVGALVVLLFILGLFIVKGPVKWALLAATVMSIMLAWGKNFMGFTDFFIDYVPLYAKFRTVESILVIAEFTMPLLAIMAMKKIVDDPSCLTGKLNVLSVCGCVSGLLILLGIWRDAAFFVGLGLLLLVAVMVASVMRYYGIALPAGLGKTLDKEVKLTPFIVSSVLVGGVLLLFALMPSTFFDFSSPMDEQTFGKHNPFLETLMDVRMSIFTSDCWRSLGIIVAGLVAIWLFLTKRLKAIYMVGIVLVVCLFDLWQVNKRYLNDSMFRDASVKQTVHQKTELDEALLRDTTPNYRVLNLQSAYFRPTQEGMVPDQNSFMGAYSNAFNENQTSYYHKSIGGYHAAKLSRYQDLIDRCFFSEAWQLYFWLPQVGYDFNNLAMAADYITSQGHQPDNLAPVLNMLNMRYIVLGEVKWKQNGEGYIAPRPVLNPQAYGHAWMVDKVSYVNNADEEMAALQSTADLRHEAVADKKFQQVLGTSVEQDSTSTVTLDKYEPNELHYTVNSSKGGVVVFSEIYYPEWTATVDGKPVELGRVNYVLRALRVEPGKHQVVLTFKPASIQTTETIAYCSYILLLLIIAASVFLFVHQRKKTQTK